MINPLLLDVAKRKLWREPSLARQCVYRLTRLTPINGVTRVVDVAWQQIALPASVPGVRDFFHVFQIGQIDPTSLNLSLAYETWVDIDTVCMNNSVVIDAFFESGTKLSRGNSYLYLTSKNDLLLATLSIKDFDYGSEIYTEPVSGDHLYRKVSPGVSQLYLRFYSNPSINLIDWRQDAPYPSEPIVSGTFKITNNTDFANFITACQTVEAGYNGKGSSIYMLDGFIISKPLAWSTDYIGHTLSFTFDETIKEVSFWGVSGFGTFISHRDPGHTKYLAVRNTPYGLLDYHGDVDFYLVSASNGNYKGVYLGRLYEQFVRQVTHSAYAIDKIAIDRLLAHNLFLSSGTTQLMIVVRSSGMPGLANQAVRTEALYRLPYARIRDALLGGGPSYWDAAYLENSDYMRIVSAQKFSDISEQMVENALGYESAVLEVANPVKPVSLLNGATQFANVDGLFTERTLTAGGTGARRVYAYQNGSLITHWEDDTQNRFVEMQGLAVDAADWVEVLSGRLATAGENGHYFSDVYSTHTSVEAAFWGYRVYACSVTFDGDFYVPNGIWNDVTGSELYSITEVDPSNPAAGLTLSWNTALLDADNLRGCWKVGGFIQHHEVSRVAEKGYIYCSLSTDDSLTFDAGNGGGGFNPRPIDTIPPGVIDVFLNNKPLIRDVDFIVKWPGIMITRSLSSDYIDENISLLIRSYGFCNPETMTDYPPRERGWVKGGMLSVDGTYDVRNDRAIRVVVSESFLDRSQVNFAEDNEGPLLTDGRPYSISDYQVAVESFTNQDTLGWKQFMATRDQEIIAYMSSFVQGAAVRYPDIETHAWECYSPFASSIITDMLNSTLEPLGIGGSPFTKDDADAALSTYMWLLEYDPCVKGFDPQYQICFPWLYLAERRLTLDQYRFLDYVIETYLGGKTNSSHYIQIG